MNEQEKSLKFAELMGWDVFIHNGTIRPKGGGCDVDPYAEHDQGLAQFAAILLKFPEVINRFTDFDGTVEPVDFTQTNILDEILRMNGVKI